MADTPIPTPEDNSTLATTNDLVNKVKDAFDGFGDTATKVKGTLGQLQSQLGTLDLGMRVNQSLTESQTAAFGMLSTALLGVRKAFDGLADVDTRGINTFTQQVVDLQQIILKDNSLGTMAEKASALGTALKAFGASTSDVTKAVAGGFSAVSTFAMQFAMSADNALRLQNALVQLASRTGRLNELYSAAGPNLGKINYLLQQQQKSLTDTATATQLPIEAVEKYFGELGTVPGALDAQVKSSINANKNVSMLTAAIQYATGSGRKYSDVIDDLKVAFRDYNLTGEDALKFTARMGELSNRFGIELSDVQGALRGTADMFKMFGNEAEGAAKMMNGYLGALESTGISGHAALEVMKDLTTGIKNMGIAQKAFLSAQTGGAGGLMGAFQIEKLLREGKVDEVFEKVRQQMTKQFGQIVNLDEASKSPQAAAQLTKQMMILRQGPLGQFVRDDQSAIRLLEAFRAKSEGRSGAITPALSDRVVQDNMKFGVDLQKKSVTELSRIRAILETTRGAAGIANLTTLQQGFTAGTGAPIIDTESMSKLRDNLSQAMGQAASDSGRTVSDIAKGLQTKIVKDKSGQISAQIIDQYGKVFTEIGSAFKAPGDVAKQLISGLKTGLPPGITGPAPIDVSDLFISPGGGLQEAAIGVAGRPGTGGDTTANAVGLGGVPPTATVAPGKLGEIIVHVEGYCLDCGEKMKGTTQSYAVNTGQKARK